MSCGRPFNCGCPGPKSNCGEKTDYCKRPSCPCPRCGNPGCVPQTGHPDQNNNGAKKCWCPPKNQNCPEPCPPPCCIPIDFGCPQRKGNGNCGGAGGQGQCVKRYT